MFCNRKRCAYLEEVDSVCFHKPECKFCCDGKVRTTSFLDRFNGNISNGSATLYHSRL